MVSHTWFLIRLLHRYTLVSTYPVKVFSREQADLTLEDGGLAPQAALFVRPEEEEAAAAVQS